MFFQQPESHCDVKPFHCATGKAQIQSLHTQPSGDPANFSNSSRGTTLYHYTNEEGLNGILDSNELRPSLSSVNPNDVRYGEGQYLTDIVPGSKTPDQVSRQLLGFPWQGQKFTHFIEINTDGLNVVEGRSGVFVIPNTTPLDLTDRIVSYGAVKAK